jgi:uncharacterized protein YqeY
LVSSRDTGEAAEVSLRATLEEDLKDAMRKRDPLRRSVIRLVRSEMRNQEIAAQTTLDDDGILRVLSRQAQQRRESIEAYAKGDRQDLVAKEKAELAVILEYLPEQMSTEEIEGLVRQVIEDVGAAGPQDMGKVMGRVMPQVGGKAEGREVNVIAIELLKGLGA